MGGFRFFDQKEAGAVDLEQIDKGTVRCQIFIAEKGLVRLDDYLAAGESKKIVALTGRAWKILIVQF